MLKLAPEIRGECAEGDRRRTMTNGGNGDERRRERRTGEANSEREQRTGAGATDDSRSGERERRTARTAGTAKRRILNAAQYVQY